MESGGSIPHSQGLRNNSYPVANQRNSSVFTSALRSIPILFFHLRLGLSKGLIAVGLPVKMSKFLYLLPFQAAKMEEGRSAFKIVTGKPTGKRPLGRPRRRW